MLFETYALSVTSVGLPEEVTTLVGSRRLVQTPPLKLPASNQDTRPDWYTAFSCVVNCADGVYIATMTAPSAPAPPL